MWSFIEAGVKINIFVSLLRKREMLFLEAGGWGLMMFEHTIKLRDV
jgi:hypothetical protein